MRELYIYLSYRVSSYISYHKYQIYGAIYPRYVSSSHYFHIMREPTLEIAVLLTSKLSPGKTDVFVLLRPRCLLLVKLPILMVLKCGFTCMFDGKTGRTPNFDGYLLFNFPSNWPKTASTAPAVASAGAERVALPEPGFGTAPPRAERHPSCPAQPDGRRGGPLSILKLRPLLVRFCSW